MIEVDFEEQHPGLKGKAGEINVIIEEGNDWKDDGPFKDKMFIYTAEDIHKTQIDKIKLLEALNSEGEGDEEDGSFSSNFQAGWECAIDSIKEKLKLHGEQK